MSSKKLLRALAGEQQETPPIWLMRQAGRYLPEYREVRATVSGFLELCYTPALAKEVTLQPLRRFELDAAIVFADILLVPHALGVGLEFREGEGPVLEPVQSAAGLAALKLDGVAERLAPVCETLQELSTALPGHVTLIGFAGAPWTVATYVVEGRGGTDFSKTLAWGYRAPAEFDALIDLLVEATVAYLMAQIAAGAEVIQLFDSWAGALPEPLFRRWSIEPTAQIVGKLRDKYPEVPVIGFPKGAGVLYQDYARETGVTGISLDQTVPVGWAAAALARDCTIQGNLDPQALVVGGEVLATEARRIVAGLRGRPHIFNLGHGITRDTPPAHVGALINVVHDAGV